MTPIVFTDLDDTLFQTARKMADAPRDELIASRATNGSHSYMTPAQDRMVSWLISTTRVIPVTARSTEALSRCALPFTDYTVASNGAVIVTPEGDVDPEWHDRTRVISATHAAELDTVDALAYEIGGDGADGSLRHWVVMEQGLPIYACVKSNGGEEALDAAQTRIDAELGGALFRHRNGNNLAYMPHDISKKSAVEYLISRLAANDTPVWGMGDSLTDLPFMEACQMMVIPTGSQAHEIFKER